MMTKPWKKLAVVVGVVLLALSSAIAPQQASAATYTANCPFVVYYACSYYDDYLQGANLGLGQGGNVPDFANPAKYFPKNCTYPTDGNPNTDCRGQGQHFWNNIASAINCTYDYTTTIWYNQNYGGPSVTMGNAASGYSYVSLQSTGSPLWNNNRAESWHYAPVPPGTSSPCSFRD